VKLQKDLREFIELLNSRRIDYIVVGGHAVAFHGYPRFTGDIDFLVRPTPDNAARLVEALHDFGFGGVGLTVEDFTRPNRVVQLGQVPNRIDLLTTISGVDFEEAWQAKVGAELDSIPVSFLSYDHLLRNKQAAGHNLPDFNRAFLRSCFDHKSKASQFSQR
jgi:hypothetical protein